MLKLNKKIYKCTALSAAVIVLIAATIITSNKNKSASANSVTLTDKTAKSTAATDTESSLSDETTASTAVDTSKDEVSSPNEDDIKINTYTVKSGDTLESIASTYDINVNTIAQSNGLSSNAVLKDGQILEFPSIDGVLYKIKEGETLWDLSILNKIDINKIIEVNNLENPEKLKLGQKIIMPGVSKVESVALNTDSKSTSSSSKTTNTVNRGGSGISTKGRLPVSGTITSRFGKRWGKLHKGIDISASTGTNVYAFADGKVTFSGRQGSYGNLVIISHGNGLQTYYAHNSKLLVNVGQSVKKGQHIAEVGSTGNSTGPHCHFEVRKNGTPVNPLSYVK